MKLRIVSLILFIFLISNFLGSNSYAKNENSIKRAEILFKKSRETDSLDLKIKYRKEIVKIAPYTYYGYYSKAYLLSLREKPDLDSVIYYYTKAIEINPKDAFTYYNRADAYSDKSLYDKAILDYTKAIEIDPKYAEAYYNRGIAYVHKGLYDKAIEDYTKAIELNPEYAEAYYNRGIALGGRGRIFIYGNYGNKELYDEAMKDFIKAIQLDPNDTKKVKSQALSILEALYKYQPQSVEVQKLAKEIQELAYLLAKSYFDNHRITKTSSPNITFPVPGYNSIYYDYLYNWLLEPPFGSSGIILSDKCPICGMSVYFTGKTITEYGKLFKIYKCPAGHESIGK